LIELKEKRSKRIKNKKEKKFKNYWILREIGIDSVKSAVEYCAKLNGQSSIDPEELNAFLKEKKEEIRQSIIRRKYSDTIGSLVDIFKKVRIEDKTIFFNFFGEILSKHPHIFDSKFRSAYFGLSKALSGSQIMEMESYIIENFETPIEEKVQFYFSGEIHYKDVLYNGRIYITNYNLIPIIIQAPESKTAYSNRSMLINTILLLKYQHNRATISSLGFQLPLDNTCAIGCKGSFIALNGKILRNNKIKELKIAIKPYKFETDKILYFKRVANIAAKMKRIILNNSLQSS